MARKPTFVKVFKKKNVGKYYFIKNVINSLTCIYVQVKTI